MPPNRRAVSLGTDSLRQHPEVHRSARSAEIAKPAARSANRLSLSTLLQIVPKVPGGIDGVGDHALTIAEKLRERFETQTVFAAFNVSVKNVRGFEVVSMQQVQNYDHALLHY